MREQRKEAIFTSSTLDFVSLSACGDLGTRGQKAPFLTLTLTPFLTLALTPF